MELIDSFTVPVPVDRLWEVLTDVEAIAPCVPGFKLAEADDPEYRGAMTIKVGAVTVAYDATITFVERDDEARRAVLAVAGKERRGGGTVTADVTATLAGEGGQSTAEMVTEVQVTGRIAQFGRGIIADVASRLTRQFVDNLNARVLTPSAPTEDADALGSAAEAPDGSSPRTTPARAETSEALDLGATALVSVLKRLAPTLAFALLVAFVLARRAKR